MHGIAAEAKVRRIGELCVCLVKNASKIGLARLRAVGRKGARIAGVVGEGFVEARLELGSREAEKMGEHGGS